jgi:hypothetical protein
LHFDQDQIEKIDAEKLVVGGGFPVFPTHDNSFSIISTNAGEHCVPIRTPAGVVVIAVTGCARCHGAAMYTTI